MKRKISIILLIAFIFVCVFSVVILAEHDCAKCEIDNCSLCHIINRGHDFNKLLYVVTTGFLLQDLIIKIAKSNLMIELIIKKITPVTLRVKMSN